MTALLVAVGVLLVAAAVFDAVTTTIRVGLGAGPVTGRLAAGIQRAALATHDRRHIPSLLVFAGPGILVATLLVWVTLVWAGWTVVFASADGAVLASTTGVPATFGERVWFAGQTVFTLGTGDFRPGPGARVATAIAAFSGLSLVTLGLSYVIPVVSAVAGRRALAGHISSLGESPPEIVRFARATPEAFVQYMTTLVPPLTLVAEQHLAYPVLHYFHARVPRESAAITVARLDEALTVLLSHSEPAVAREAIQPVRRAIALLLDTLRGTFVEREPEPPRSPAGLDGPAEVEERRALLLALVLADGYSWEEVTGGGR